MSASLMVVEGNPAKVDGSSTPERAAAPVPRRPRVREVSSRFMSPVVSVSSTNLSGEVHMTSDRSPQRKHSARSNSVQRKRVHPEVEVFGDENGLGSGRSLENPFKGTPVGVRKPQRGAAVKLFKENNEGRAEQKNSSSDGMLRSSGGIEVASKFMAPKRRPDTPNVTTSFDKMQHNRPHRFTGSATPSVARQLQLFGLSSAGQISSKIAADDSDSSSMQQIGVRDSISSDASSVDSNSCSSSPIPLQKCKTPRADQVRSSMPESSMSITVSSRYLGDRTGNRGISSNSTKMSASPCCRSLNMSISSGIQHGLSNGNNLLPPHPPSSKAVTDAKARKVNSQQENIHSLRMLHNRYLQWRFSNAKAEAAMLVQIQSAERMLYSLSIKISDLRESVMRKRNKLGFLRRSKMFFSIIEAQMPDLENWGSFEEEFVASLSETINALLNASVHLPTSGKIKADANELREALTSAFGVMETIESHISSFLPKAAEMDKLLSELARVSIVERNYIEESGDLLYKTHMLQVDECSSLAQLIQLKQRRGVF